MPESFIEKKMALIPIRNRGVESNIKEALGPTALITKDTITATEQLVLVMMIPIFQVVGVMIRPDRQISSWQTIRKNLAT